MTCPSTQYHDDSTYVPEMWTWFIIGTLVTILRLAVTFRQVGCGKWQGDDILALVVWMCFACKSIALTMVFKYGTNMDYYSAEAVAILGSCQLDQVVTGSKMELVAWYAYCSIIWGLKGMVLFILARFRLVCDRIWLFRTAAVMTGISYAAMFLSLCLGCLPYRENWQVDPPPPSTCSFRMHDVYVSAILNVTTDLLILAIPLPILWKIRVSLGKKIGLILLLCSGIFVMAAALIRFGFVQTGSTSSNLNKWCQRETTIGIIVVNMPILWTWIKPLFISRASMLPARGCHPLSVVNMPCQETPPLYKCGLLPSTSDAPKLPHGTGASLDREVTTPVAKPHILSTVRPLDASE